MTSSASSASSPRRVNGPRVRDLRAKKDLTQEQLADAAAVASRTIRGIEAGTITYPWARTVARLAAALGVESSELLVDEPATATPANG